MAAMTFATAVVFLGEIHVTRNSGGRAGGARMPPGSERAACEDHCGPKPGGAPASAAPLPPGTSGSTAGVKPSSLGGSLGGATRGVLRGGLLRDRLLPAGVLREVSERLVSAALLPPVSPIPSARCLDMSVNVCSSYEESVVYSQHGKTRCPDGATSSANPSVPGGSAWERS